MSTPLAKIREKVLAAGGIAVPEHIMKSLLAKQGVPVPRGTLCRSLEEARGVAGELGFPVVIKASSEGLLHKTEAGGVQINIGSMALLEEEFTAMNARFAGGRDPGFQGILVEQQVAAGTEIIVGFTQDETFGPQIMVGIGGIFTDIFEDVAFRPLPVSSRDIDEMLRGLAGYRLLGGYRNNAAVDMDSLISVIHALSRFGEEAAPYYSSIDCNPLIAGPGGTTVADAKLVLSASVYPEPFAVTPPDTRSLASFFNPASVAVIGASAGEGKIGNVIVDSLSRHDFSGRIYPINPNRKELMGLPCYPDLKSLPEVPKLAVIVVDLKELPSIMEEMHRLGIKNALVVSGGGKELGGERADLEKKVAALSRETGIRVIGPNCIGSFDGASRFDSFFHSHERLHRPKHGPLSFITQSGTWGCSYLEMAEPIGVGKMVSYGNRVDVDEGDLVAYLADDPGTGVIGCYLEGLGNGRKLAAAIGRAVNAKKPVALFKTGRNRQSATAAMSHTGAYGGSYPVYEGALRQAGAVLADSFHELYAATVALALQPPARGSGAAMLSNGAGPMVNALDLFPRRGLSLATLSRQSVKSMRDHFSFFYLVENPVDVTGSATAADYEYVITTMMHDDNVHVIMPFFVFQDTPLDESIVRRLQDVNTSRKKPIIGCAVGGGYTERMSRALLAAGIPVFPDVAQWTAAASAVVQWGATLRRGATNH